MCILVVSVVLWRIQSLSVLPSTALIVRVTWCSVTLVFLIMVTRVSIRACPVTPPVQLFMCLRSLVTPTIASISSRLAVWGVCSVTRCVVLLPTRILSLLTL